MLVGQPSKRDVNTYDPIKNPAATKSIETWNNSARSYLPVRYDANVKFGKLYTFPPRVTTKWTRSDESPPQILSER